MQYVRVERVPSSKLRRAPPTADCKTGNLADNPHSVPFGKGGGQAHRPLPPTPRVILGRRRHLRACILISITDNTQLQIY